MEIAVLFALDHYKLIDHNVVSGREKKLFVRIRVIT
jgi:hypothetical protein